MAEVAVARLIELPGWQRHIPAIDAIFFASSHRQVTDEGERAAFRERWLGRYLLHDPTLTFVAVAAGTVIGYIVGSHDDPARAARFSDLGYLKAFAPLTRLYPAQLHINLDASWRSRGIGQRLIAAFIAEAAAAGAPGVHLVTGAASRNISFYERAGFVPAACTSIDGGRRLMMVRQP